MAQHPPPLYAYVDSWLLSADVGVVLRPYRALELRAGAGICRLSGSVGGEHASRTSPTFVLTALYASPPSLPSRGLRIGLEARKVVGGTLDFPVFGPAQSSAVEVADLSFVALVGYEFAR